MNTTLNEGSIPAPARGENVKVPALPTWRVIWDMLKFRPGLWGIDLLSVALIRFCWQIAPALIERLRSTAGMSTTRV